MASGPTVEEFIDITGHHSFPQEDSPVIDCAPIDSISDVEKGDHVIYCTTDRPYVPVLHSALVTESNGTHLTLIHNGTDGVKEVTKPFSELLQKFLYKVYYQEMDVLEVNESIRIAKKRKSLCEEFYNQSGSAQAAQRDRISDTYPQQYHPLKNNSHHFVTLCKCGFECQVSSIIPNIEKDIAHRRDMQASEQLDVNVDLNQATSSSVSDEDAESQIEGAIEMDIAHRRNMQASEQLDVDTDLNQATSSLSDEDAESQIEGATGTDSDSLPDNVSDLHSQNDVNANYGLVLRTRKCSNIKRGDHITNMSTHWLVEAVTGRQFTGYTYCMGKIVTQTVTVSHELHQVLYPEEVTKDTDINAVLGECEMDLQKKDNISVSSSDQYVTNRMCGKGYIIDKTCIINDDNPPVGYTCITPNVMVAEGDHLLIPDSRNSLTSVIAYRIAGRSTILVLSGTSEGITVQGYHFTLGGPQVYRVNYKQHLPPSEILRRALSPTGKQLLQKADANACKFVTWACVGQELDINVDELIKQKPKQIKCITPTIYKCITDLSEVEPGDHLFIPYTGYRWHFMVTESNVRTNRKLYKVIYCLRGSVKETIEEIDPDKGNVFKVFYSEQLPPNQAIKNARSHLHEIHLQALYRLDFVPLVKTGSKEGLEIDLMEDLSVPTSKDSISCFTQLKRGDYLVVDYKGSFVYHHFFVIDVLSPEECFAIEMNVTTSKKCIKWRDCTACFRLNYSTGVCRPPDESLNIAESLGIWNTLTITRMAFVNFLKTGNSTKEIEVSPFQDRRFYFEKEEVTNARKLNIGDHIVRPMCLPKSVSDVMETGKRIVAAEDDFISNKMHHMLVTEPMGERSCRVIEATGKVKSNTLTTGFPEEHEVVFKSDQHLFRVIYPERLCPAKGIKRCRQECTGKLDDANSTKNKYCDSALYNNRLEYFFIKESVDIGVSEQLRQLEALSIAIRAPVKSSIPLGVGESLVAISSPKEVTMAMLDPRDFLGSAFGRTAAQTGIKGSIVESAETSLNPLLSNTFRIGHRTVPSGASVGLVSRVTGGVNLGIEGALLTRGVYKLKRQRKFNKISETEFKRGVTKETFTRVNTFLGATGGAIVGQMVIPVPGLGAAFGGVIGSLIGRGAGEIEGRHASKLIKEKDIQLPVIVHCEYTEIDE